MFLAFFRLDAWQAEMLIFSGKSEIRGAKLQDSGHTRRSEVNCKALRPSKRICFLRGAKKKVEKDVIPALFEKHCAWSKNASLVVSSTRFLSSTSVIGSIIFSSQISIYCLGLNQITSCCEVTQEFAIDTDLYQLLSLVLGSLHYHPTHPSSSCPQCCEIAR